MASALDYDAVLWDFCRSESYCDLNLTDPVCGYDSVAPVDALSFTVQDNVQVKAVVMGDSARTLHRQPFGCQDLPC